MEREITLSRAAAAAFYVKDTKEHETVFQVILAGGSLDEQK